MSESGSNSTAATMEPAGHEGQSTNIGDFLRILHPKGAVFELRSPDCPNRKGSTFCVTASGYFDTATAAANEARRLDSLAPPAVYVTLIPVKPVLLARSDNRVKHDKRADTTTDKQIIARRWLMVDLDPSREAKISATEDEMQAALDLAERIEVDLRHNHGWPDALSGGSGNGAYLLYRIDLPNDDNARDLVKAVLHGLAAQYDTETVTVDKSTFNAARICKVLGTMARKGDRPSIVVTSDEGCGVGKSKLVEMLTHVPRGMVKVEPGEDFADVRSRLISPDTLAQRAVLIDNVKPDDARRGHLSWGEREGQITSSIISGWAMYVGNGTRPNTLTWFITLNGARLSKDMAQRSVIIKVRKTPH